MNAQRATAPARPLRADAERNRARILQAAAEVFARRGLEAGLDEIARHAGVGTGTVYRRFPDKTLLLDALLDERMEKFEDLVERVTSAPDPWTGLQRFMTEALEMQVADRALTEMLFTSDRHAEVMDARKQRLRPIIEDLVRRAQAEGDLRDDIESTDLAALQLMLTLVSSLAEPIHPGLWHRLLSIVLDGLTMRREAPSPLPGTPLSQDEFEQACSGPRPCPPAFRPQRNEV